MNRMDNEEMRRIVGIIDVYTFAIQVLALVEGCDGWNEDPAIAVHEWGQRIVSANRLAKHFGIEPNSTQKNEAIEKLSQNHVFDLRIYTIPAYPTRKPDQTELRKAARRILREILVEIPKSLIKWDVPPIVEWVPLDEVYFDLTGQIDYVIKTGIHEKILYPQGVKAHMQSSFGNNIVGTPDDAVSIQNGSPTYPLNRTKNLSTKLWYGCTSKPTEEKDIRKALGVHYICKIMDHLYRSTGLHCSGGVGPNKMLAKAACSMVKPGTLLYMDPASFRKKKHAAKIPIKKISVLDSELRKVLKESGAETLYDVQIMARNGNIMRIGLGDDEVTAIQDALQGIDPRLVILKHHTKHVNCAKNFVFRPIQTKHDLWRHSYYLLKEFKQRLKEEHQENRVPERMFAIFSYDEDHYVRKPFQVKQALSTFKKILNKDIDYRRKIIKIRVSGSNLRPIKPKEDISETGSLVTEFKALCF